MGNNGEKIAIIGMGCLLPGGNTPEEFYQSLLNHNEYLDQDIVHDIDLKKLDCDVDENELDTLDDVFKYNVYVAHEALKDSGYLNNKPVLKNTGLIMGNRETPNAKTFDLFKPIYLNELERNIRDLLNRPEFTFNEPDDSENVSPLNAYPFSYPVIYAAHALSMKGPAFAIDAACAASLYTTKMAMHYLLSGQTDMMVAGGVFCGKRNKGFPYFLRKLGVTPDQAKSRPLDKNSGGMVAHEGGGAFVLKRLSDAIRDKDTIHAVIDRLGWSNDGTGKFFLAPSKEGQIIAYRNTYEKDEPDDIDYIECHATGTQVGDSIELNSMEGFYGHRTHVPLFGAEKGNIGHLLTGAGAASMIKVIMSMKNGVIPATINVTEPLSSEEGFFSGKNMVLENTPWPDSTRGKKAAINAFGFGGINSHMIIREYRPEEDQIMSSGINQDMPLAKTAITGIGLHFGNIEGVKSFNDALFYGKQPNPEKNLRRLRGMEQNQDFLTHLKLKEGIPEGFYQSSFDFDYLKNKAYPKDDHEAIDKEMLLLKIAGEALVDAGIEPGLPQNIATIVCAKQNLCLMSFYVNSYLTDFVRSALASANISLDEEQSKALAKIARRSIDFKENDFDRIATGIGPIIATRISALWNFTGPAFKMSCLDNSFLRGLEFGKFLLETGEVDAVLLGVVDNDPLLETLIWHHCYGKDYGMDPAGVVFSEGAAAIVLKRAVDIGSDGKKYAHIDNIHIQREDPPFSACHSFPNLAAGFHSPLNASPDNGGHPGYLEFYGRAARHEVAQETLQKLDKTLINKDNLSIPVGYSADQFGYNQMSGQAASIIKAALMLHYSYKPPTLKKILDTQLTKWSHRALSLEPSALYWQRSQKDRLVSVTGTAMDGSSGHVMLSEGTISSSDMNSTAVNPPMILLAGKDQDGLLNDLHLLKTALEKDPSLPYLAEIYKAQFVKREGQNNDFVMVLLGDTKEKLLIDVNDAIYSIKDVFANQGEWQGANGSFFTVSPLKETGKIALVYMPSGLNSHNALYELTATFPQLVPFYNRFVKANAHQQHGHITQFNEYLKSKEQLPLYMDAILAGLTTELIVNVLGIHPQMILGCSFGELIMYSASGMLTEESTTDLINDVVAPLMGKLSDPEHIKHYYKDDHAEWVTYYCKDKQEKIRNILNELAQTDKAFLTIKAAPEHIIISGLKKECKRIIKKATCFAYQLSRNIFVHTAPAMMFYDEIYKGTLSHPFTFNSERKSIYYSTWDCAPFSFSKEQFARNMANCICKTIDFEAVIKQSHSDGARIFIGMDSSDLSSEWIASALDGRPALILPIKKSNVSLNQSVSCLIAKLISHKIPMNMDQLIHYPNHQATNKGLVKAITHNPQTIREIILTAENIAIFHPPIVDVPVEIPEIPQVDVPPEISSVTPIPEKIQSVSKVEHKMSSASPPMTPVMMPAMTDDELQKRFDQNMQLHQVFMEVQSQLNDLVHDRILSQYGTGSAHQGERNAVGHPTRKVIWDERQIIEMTAGKLSNVLGSRYEEADHYPVRARLPLPPFLFVSRVTAIDAEFGKLRPSRIEIEYDIPVDAWYISNGKVPLTIVSESSHCGILLLSYIGVDILFGGKRRFRALNSNTLILSEKMFCGGETVRGVFQITSFATVKDNTLAFFTYELFDESNTCIFTNNGVGGFFSEEELMSAKGYLESAKSVGVKSTGVTPYSPLIICDKSAFDDQDIINLQNGKNDLCFGAGYNRYDDREEQLYSDHFKVLSRIPAIDKNGGDYGLGWIKGEADIDPDYWIFDTHFKNDPVLPAIVIIEGGVQLLSFYAHYIGLKALAGPGSSRNTLLDTESKSIFRGEVKRDAGKVIYECHIRKITAGPEITISADIKAYCKERVVVIVQGMSMKMISAEGKRHAALMVA